VAEVAGAEDRPEGEERPDRAEAAERLGGALVGIASLQFGAVVVLGKIVTDSGLSVPSFLALRFGAAALFLALVQVARRRPLLAAPGEGWRLGLLGMIGYSLESGLFFAALRLGTAPAVTLLFFTYPVWVTLIAIATGKGAPGWLIGGALACSVAGASAVVLSSGGVDITTLGVLLALGSALTFSFYLTGADAVLERTDSLTGSMWVSGAAAAGLAAFALLTGSAEPPQGLRQWAPVLGAAAFTAGAFACLFAGLRRLGPVRSSIVSATEPLAATILAAVFLGDPVRLGTAAGGLLIMAGAVAASLARRHLPAEPPVP
jgi:drug/metabolite transporter (DMT)-like permease